MYVSSYIYHASNYTYVLPLYISLFCFSKSIYRSPHTPLYESLSLLYFMLSACLWMHRSLFHHLLLQMFPLHFFFFFFIFYLFIIIIKKNIQHGISICRMHLFLHLKTRLQKLLGEHAVVCLRYSHNEIRSLGHGSVGIYISQLWIVRFWVCLWRDDYALCWS